MVRDVAPVHSESESERETRRASRKDQPASRDAMDVDVDEENGEEEGDEEFEIEKILDARMGMFPSGRMGYFVKWKGYGDEQNSWVDEQDAGNANDLIDEYWSRNKKPNARGGRKSAAGRPGGRQSMGATPSGRKSVARESSEELEEVRPKKRGRPSKAKKAESGDGSADELEGVSRAKKPKKAVGKTARDASAEDAEGFTSMKQWKNEDTWDHLVDTIDTVERADNGELMIYFTLKNGARCRENSKVCKTKMADKLVDFYEANLRWRVVAGEE